MPVPLLTAHGEIVTNVEMPEFRFLPEVVLWGSRCFRLVDDRRTAAVYVECFAWRAPEKYDGA